MSVCCADATGMPVPCQHPAAPEPDPIPDHYPHPDGYQRDCRRCVIDATPQPDTALTVERLARALHFHDFGKYPSIVPCGHIGDAANILRALGEGVES